jgi:hypothetical protein
MRSVLLGLILAMMAGSAVAQDWGKIATVSATMGVSGSRLCLGEASRGDIGCPSYAPSVSTTGDLTVSGTVKAAAGALQTTLKVSGTTYVSDLVVMGAATGAGVDPSFTTGLTTTDRITSGTLSMVAFSSSGYISLTTAGTTWGYLSSGASYIPSLTANVVSATRFYGDGSGLTNLSVSGDRITSGTLSMVAVSNTGYVSLTTGGTTWGYLSSGASFLPSLSTSFISATAGAIRNTFTVSGTTYVSDLVVMGTATGAGVDPSFTTGSTSSDRIVSGSVYAVAGQTSGTVQVSGTLALANTGNEPCDTAHAYSLRINPTTKMVQMCRP